MLASINNSVTEQFWLFWGTSLVIQWLRLCASNVGVVGSIPGQGTKILCALLHGQKTKTKTPQSIGHFLLFSISKTDMITLCKLRIYLEQLIRLLDQGLDYDENSQ